MIASCYMLSAVVLLVTDYLFTQGSLDEFTPTLGWTISFFFASAGASAAYLTVSEIFPLEIRASAIAFFYAIGSAAGGIAGPIVFAKLVETGEESSVYLGYMIAAALMIFGGR